ncbi:MAG: DNA-directed RNA polymerase subunit N [Candidatus Woesearchaeota archaeon]|jgi:DNA-directed RNA polymerase subunit N (RpoN/RPB10)
MIIPVRCYSCGKPVAHLYEEYLELVKSGKSKQDALNQVGLDRYCCRALFIGHVDLIDTIGRFKKF